MKNKILQIFFILFIPAIFVLMVIAAIKLLTDHTILELASDVSEVAALHPFAGILSSLGILLWSATTSVLFFTAILLRTKLSAYLRNFLLFSALLTGYLLADDLFSVHEMLGPAYLGLNEKYIYLFIALLAVSYTIYFLRFILSSGFRLFFIIAILFLGFSMLCDTILKQFMPPLGDWRHLLEEGTKWLGICSWSGYYILTSHDLISEKLYHSMF